MAESPKNAPACYTCGLSYPTGRKELGYRTCLVCGDLEQLNIRGVVLPDGTLCQMSEKSFAALEESRSRLVLKAVKMRDKKSVTPENAIFFAGG